VPSPTTTDEVASGSLPRPNWVSAWALIGVVALLSWAIIRLTPIAVEAFTASQLGPIHYVLAVFWAAFMLVAEGYKGFYLRFAPRVVTRALLLRGERNPVYVIFAPLVAIGYLKATRRRRIASWALIVGISGLVVLVRMLPQPWRGLVDVGVVLGLAVGVGSVFVWFARALVGQSPGVDPQFPDGLG
jgi:hypothetical protein